MRQSAIIRFAICVIALIALSCEKTVSSKPLMFFNITSDAVTDPHSVTMAMQLANHSLNDGREVVLFFNVKGVGIPTKQLDASIAFKAKPVKELLADLVAKGTRIHVCPHCMKAMGIEEKDLIEGAAVTSRDKLFSELTSNSLVFTY